jgi:hypothetical protein
MAQAMTLKEQLAIGVRAAKLREAGRDEEAMELSKTIPMPTWLAKVFLKLGYTDYLRTCGWNMSEVEADLGPDWLSQ